MGAAGTAESRHYEQFTPLNAISVIASAATKNNNGGGRAMRDSGIPASDFFVESDVITGGFLG